MTVKLHVLMTPPGSPPREINLSFDTARISIGRGKSNDVVIPIETISRQHAILGQDGQDWILEDLHSTHGTSVNALPLAKGAKHLMRDGDMIELHGASIRFRLMSAIIDDSTSVVARQLVKDALQELKDGGDSPYLRMMNGPKEGTKIELVPELKELLIGRGSECDLRLDDTAISRKHAKIVQSLERFQIEDLGSRNGILINTLKVQGHHTLEDGDEISIGPFHIAFVDKNAQLMRQQEAAAKAAKEAAQKEQRESAQQEAADAKAAEQAENLAENAADPTQNLPQEASTLQVAPKKKAKMSRFSLVDILLIAGIITVLVALIIAFVLIME